MTLLQKSVDDQVQSSLRMLTRAMFAACVCWSEFLILRRVELNPCLDSVSARIFATTQWTVIEACRQPAQALARDALSEVCQVYWQPVYLCIRHYGHSTHDAEDLTQDFFVRLLEGNWLDRLDPAKGRFRAYLSVALRNFLHDQGRRRWTLRRGRGVPIVSFDSQEAEASYELMAVTHITPEFVYERLWAQVLLANTFDQLRIEMRAAGKEFFLDHFDAILAAETRNFPFQAMASSSGLTVGALHAALHRWRQRLHVLIREEISRTVASKSEIEEELRHLHRVFA